MSLAAGLMLVGWTTTARALDRAERIEDEARYGFPTLPDRGTYMRLLAGVGLGRGVRLNNPFRLSTQLGDSSQSLSATANYFDAWLAAAFGEPDGVQHGIAVHGALALDGIAQEVITPGYLAWWQPSIRFGVFGRAGLPIVIEPDANVGYEVAIGGIFWVTAAFGAGAEIVGDLFYGAATPEVGRTVIPVVSLQLGAVYQFEVLP
jgi:hypothetical protein